jgi:dinuclear metal center YbgI/SA1388 family protein
VRLHAVADLLEELAPSQLAAEWDNSGWQLRLDDHDLRALLISVDATPAVVKEAREMGANLLITHHPLFFGGLRRLDAKTLAGQTALAAAWAGLSILSLHTNLDAAPRGTSWALAEALGLEGLRVLEPGQSEDSGFGLLTRAAAPRSLGNWASLAQHRLASRPLAVSGNLDESHHLVAVMGGSGGAHLDHALASGASLYITADIRYHEAQKAHAANLSLIVLDHFASERPVLAQVASFLEARLSCPVAQSSRRTSPWEADRA